MTKPTITIHNLETDEVVTRDLNAKELVDYEETKSESQARAAQMQSQADGKAALLEKLGITEDEAKLLLS